MDTDIQSAGRDHNRTVFHSAPEAQPETKAGFCSGFVGGFPLLIYLAEVKRKKSMGAMEGVDAQMKSKYERLWICDGSLTVEASCVIPVILLTLSLIIICTLALHEKSAAYFYNMGYAVYSMRRNRYAESVETTLETCHEQSSFSSEWELEDWRMEEIIRLQGGVIQEWNKRKTE